MSVRDKVLDYLNQPNPPDLPIGPDAPRELTDLFKYMNGRIARNKSRVAEKRKIDPDEPHPDETASKSLCIDLHISPEEWQLELKSKKVIGECPYTACLVLGAVGDTIGYGNGVWEFNRSGPAFHRDIGLLGGVKNLDLYNYIVSDDTVMTLALCEALIEAGENISDEHLFPIIANHFVECMKDMKNRAPGNCTMTALKYIEDGQAENGYMVSFNPNGGGCGAAMRSVPIGLRFPRPDQQIDLIRVAIESGRITHHHPTGYLGAVAVALFTSYAIQKIDLVEWGMRMMKTMDQVEAYIRDSDREVDSNIAELIHFKKRWLNYLHERNLLFGMGPAKFPEKYGIKERDDFYNSLNDSHFGGATGIDAPIIAYDALLASNENWLELCNRAMIHGGDSDSTGIIAGSLFGLLYSINSSVPQCHFHHIEKLDQLTKCGAKMYNSFFNM